MKSAQNCTLLSDAPTAAHMAVRKATSNAAEGFRGAIGLAEKRGCDGGTGDEAQELTTVGMEKW